jgi:hypothetical protein
MASAEVQDQLGQVLINFTTNGAFPEEESVSAAYVQKPYLAPALEALSAARSELEVSPPTTAISRTMELTRTTRQRYVRSAANLPPMSINGSSMRNQYKTISTDRGGWQALL